LSEVFETFDIQHITETERSEFVDTIEDLVWENDIGYIEAITQYCDNVGMEIETVVKLISDNLKSEIEAEAVALLYIKPESRLPL